MVMATLATISTKALYLKLLVIIYVTKIVVYIKEPTVGWCQPTVASLVYMPKLISSFHSSRTSCLIAPSKKLLFMTSSTIAFALPV